MASGNLASAYADLFYVNSIDGTALTTTTATNIEPATATVPGPALPSAWLNQAYTLRCVNFLAKGVVSTAASAPGTLTMSVALGSTPTVLAATPAFTPAVSLANGYWEFRGDIIFRSVGTAGLAQASATLKMANGAGATTDLIEYGAPQNTVNTSWPVAFDTTMAAALTPVPFHIRATWGTAPAGDSILLTVLKIWCEN